MKRKLLTAFIVCSSVLANGQDFLPDPSLAGLYKFSKEYFRSDPFKSEFSGFLQHLINDPGIEQKIIKKRTDTSLYSFEGVYSKYNPFFFKPSRLEISLQEMKGYFTDSLKGPDTIFVYQLIAYTTDDPKNAEDIKKEFEKIHRRNNRSFFSNTYEELRPAENVFMALHNYFLGLYWVAPLTVVRGELKSQHELFLNITMRFKMDSNEAVLIAPFNKPE